MQIQLEVYIYHKSGKKYIKRDKDGQFVHVSSKNSATKFEEAIARRIITNQFKVAERQHYTIKPVVEPSVDKVKFTLTEENSFTDDATDEKLISISNHLLNGLTSLNQLASDLDEYEKQLSLAMSKYDSARTDIEHYMEFNKLGAVDGYKAYKLAHDWLNKRRDIKIAFEKLRLFKEYWSKIDTQGLQARAEHIDIKQYTPRLLTELFEDCKVGSDD